MVLVMPNQESDSIDLIYKAPAKLGSLMLLSCACLMFSASTADAKIYKAIGPNGEIVFTDQPYEALETIQDEVKKPVSNSAELSQKNLSPEAQDAYEVEDWSVPTEDVVALTPEPVAPPQAAMPANDYEDDHAEIRVSRVDILSPLHDSTFLNPGPMWIEFQSYPMPIRETGLTAELWMDNEKITSAKTFMLRLPPPPFGTHTLQIKLVDADGRLFMQSDTIQLHTKY